MSGKFPDKLYVLIETDTPLTDPPEDYLVAARVPEEFAELGETKRVAVYTFHHTIEVSGTVEVHEVR